MQQIGTIYALSTPFGKSGVAVIRISGPEALNVLTDLGVDIVSIKHRYAKPCYIKHPHTKESLDYSVIIYFKGPESFTGEDIVELQVHGGRAVINSVLDALSIINYARLAGPGEFSKRAFLNGKMDLTQAEGLADLIDAETRMQQKQAMKQISGTLSNLYDSWRKIILQTMSLIEAGIDFPEEDIPESIIEVVKANIIKLTDEINRHVHDNNKGEKLRSGIKVAIIGRPNAGKSSLINYLAKREVAIVSEIAGTTRDIIEVYLDINGFPFIVFDTAGLRDSSDEIERLGIQRAHEKIEEADIIIKLYDAEDLTETDLLGKLHHNEIIAINKIDKNITHAFITYKDALLLSAKSGQGVDGLISRLNDFAKNFESDLEEAVITRARYRELCLKCLTHLKNFSLDRPIEIAAEDLRLAAFELGCITGRIDVEEILGEIFSNFCIGK